MKRNVMLALLALGTVACLVLVLTVSKPASSALLENDAVSAEGPVQIPDGGTFILEDGDVPLTDLPVELPEEDAYEGLDEQQIAYVEEVVVLVNEARVAEGLAPLTLDPSLRKAAQVRAAECVTHFSHTRPDGTKYKTAIEQAGIRTGYTGENAASGYTSAQHVVSGWLSSPGHRANILNENFTIIGVGLEKNVGNGFGGYSWCQLFVK